MAKGIDDLDQAIAALEAAGRASTQIASLLRSKKALDASERSDALEQALTEVMKGFNLR